MTLVCPTCGHPLAAHLDIDAIAAVVPMGEVQRRIFDRLNRRFGAWVTTSDLVDYVYWDHSDGGPENAENSVAVMVHELRRNLRPHSLTIEGHAARVSRGRRLAWLDQPAAPK